MSDTAHAAARAAAVAAGCPDHLADDLVKLKAPAEARGLDWTKLIPLVLKYGPSLIKDLQDLFA